MVPGCEKFIPALAYLFVLLNKIVFQPGDDDRVIASGVDDVAVAAVDDGILVVVVVVVARLSVSG